MQALLRTTYQTTGAGWSLAYSTYQRQTFDKSSDMNWHMDRCVQCLFLVFLDGNRILVTPDILCIHGVICKAEVGDKILLHIFLSIPGSETSTGNIHPRYERPFRHTWPVRTWVSRLLARTTTSVELGSYGTIGHSQAPYRRYLRNTILRQLLVVRLPNPTS